MPSAQKNRQQTQVRSKEFNWDKAMEMAENMLHFMEVMAPMEQEHQRLQRKLKEYPEGFHLEGKGYICGICYGPCSKEETWYDKYGIRCMECKVSVDRGDIPASCAKERDCYYSPWEIERAFNVDRHVIRRWVKAGVLKERVVEHAHHANTHMFLMEDNKETLPPKEMVEHHSSHEHLPNGKTKVHTTYWYQQVDPFKYLKGYKIMDHLQMVDGKLQAKPKEKK